MGTPPIFLSGTPRHAAGHGKGGGCYKGLSFPVKESPCYTNLRYLFILLNSEKYEPRSAAAVIGLLARRYGRRRGLRNSLRSDSPRPFSSVFLATSPPDKGGDFARAFAGLFNPLALWALPLYRCAAQGERDMHHSVLVIEGISPSPLPCPVALREVVLAIGETPQKW